MPAVSYVLKNNLNWSGKVSVISGLRHELKEFTEKLERYFYDK